MFETRDSRLQPDDDLAAPRAAPESPLPAEDEHARPGAVGRSRWHWLLAVAVVVPLLTPLYNRDRPRLLGLPFFYWSQMAFIALAAGVTMTVYLATRKRGS